LVQAAGARAAEKDVSGEARQPLGEARQPLGVARQPLGVAQTAALI
jgi:hypothetical protein